MKFIKAVFNYKKWDELLKKVRKSNEALKTQVNMQQSMLQHLISEQQEAENELARLSQSIQFMSELQDIKDRQLCSLQEELSKAENFAERTLLNNTLTIQKLFKHHRSTDTQRVTVLSAQGLGQLNAQYNKWEVLFVENGQLKTECIMRPAYQKLPSVYKSVEGLTSVFEIKNSCAARTHAVVRGVV